jgi:hypothetical protein
MRSDFDEKPLQNLEGKINEATILTQIMQLLFF